MLLFLWIIRTNYQALYLFFNGPGNEERWVKGKEGWIMHFCVTFFGMYDRIA